MEYMRELHPHLTHTLKTTLKAYLKAGNSRNHRSNS